MTTSPEVTEATALEIARRESFVVLPPLVATVLPSVLSMVELRVQLPDVDRYVSMYLTRYTTLHELTQRARAAWVRMRDIAVSARAQPADKLLEPSEA